MAACWENEPESDTCVQQCRPAANAVLYCCVLPESFDRAQLTTSVLANDVASDKRLKGEEAHAGTGNARLLHLESLGVRLWIKINSEPRREQNQDQAIEQARARGAQDQEQEPEG